ncbi:caspase family protein [Moorena sp. SIO4A5]|uniref:nSTAND1 domain-containing NTPase n=1 Tax=Moorena sp. SIO4A5 TaxID=2607838 RepID=UPI0013CAAE0D|nr:caspase family protein [Moorena sp. SIO4A5]NEO23846.1 hypothetical protein [Moorena sp. SIO4A5]
MFSRNLAFIIGIDNYTNGISPLNTAVNDAKQLAEILRQKHDYEVWECLDEVATLSNFHKFLFHTLPQQVTENDRLLFYFAGHGVALNGDDGPAGYLIPQDAKLGDTNSYLPMTKLHDALIKLPCRHFLGILDCCFAGAFKWSSTRELLTSPEVIHQERYDRFISDPAWQIITSSASDQKALDNFNLDSVRGQFGNHSPFAAALLEALEGAADIYPLAKNGKPAVDGVITATELYLHLRDRVEIPTGKYRQRQTPGIWCLNKHDKGEYIFLSPGHELNLPPAPPLDESQNPYRGLKSFDEKHSALFFGRTLLVEKLEDFVKAHPLTVVLGASGSGKSSLVKAGLIPKLRQSQTEKWCILPPIRPGETPLEPLNNLLTEAKLPRVEPQNPQQNLAMSIDVWAKNHPNSKLLLFIDQSEEIITFCQNLDERKEFFQQILTAINAHGDKLRVVLSLRSDFEAQVRDAGLTFVGEELNWGRFIVPAMTRGELREAIEKPAQARVMYFEPHELVEQLIDEVADMPGALPLLSFALSELFLKYLRRQREAQYRGITIDRALTQADYMELGGVMRSLTQRADEEYQALVNENPAYDQVIRHVMLRMVALTGGELARRRVPLSELEYPGEKNGLVKEVIERFTNARLLVIGEDTDGNPYVEPAHDALVRGWQKLLEWKHLDEENLLLQRRLTPAAEEWKSQQKARFLWNANPRLDLLKKVSLSDDNWLNQVEAEFVRRSIGRKSFNTRRNWGIAIAVMLGLSGLTIAALIGQQNALIQEINALIEASEANLLSNNQFDAMVKAIKAKKQLNNVWIGKDGVSLSVLGILGKTVHHNQKGWRERLRLQGTDVIFSPDGKQLATIDDKIVRVWDGVTGQLLHTLRGHENLVSRVVFSPDGKQLATASPDKTVRVWDGATGKLLHTLRGHEGGVRSVVFSPDGKQLATASFDDKARMWDGATGKLWHTLRGHEGGVRSVVFSPDGKQLATASDDHTARMWDGATGKLWHTLRGHEGGVRSVVFSPDGKQLATASFDDKARVWDGATGKLLHTLRGHEGGVRSVVFSPDGKQLATASFDDKARVWDQATGKLLHTLQRHEGEVISVLFSPDGKQLATASFDKTARVWDRATGKLLHTLQGHEREVISVVFSPDGKQLVTASGDKTARVWDRATGELLLPLQGHENLVSSVVFSPDGKQLATASDDHTARIWHGATGKLLHTLRGHENPVWSVVFSPDGKQLATASPDKTVRIWHGATGKLLHTLPGHENLVWSVVFSPDGKQLATASDDHTARIWHGATGKLWHTLRGHEGGVRSVVFSPDGKQLATASDDHTARIWHGATGKLLHTLRGHEGGVRSVVFSPDGKQLATASPDKTARIWHGATGKLLHTLRGHEGEVRSVVFSPDGKQLATASDDHTARIWHGATGKLLHTLREHENPVWSMVFSPDGKQLATASPDKTVRIWHGATGKLLNTLRGHENLVLSVVFSPDGKQLATASNDNTARLSRVGDIKEMLTINCNWVRHYLQNHPNVDEIDRDLCENVKR